MRRCACPVLRLEEERSGGQALDPEDKRDVTMRDLVRRGRLTGSRKGLSQVITAMVVKGDVMARGREMSAHLSQIMLH